MDIESLGRFQIENGFPIQLQGLIKEYLISQSSFRNLVKGLFLLHLCLHHARTLLAQSIHT